MTFDESWEADYFDASAAQGHLLIVRVFDAPQYYRSTNNPDGMVHPVPGRSKFTEPFPNSVVRAAIVDLDVAADDGTRGKLYEEAVLFPSSLTGTMRKWVKKGMKLLVMRKDGPRQTDPYVLTNMAGNPQAVAIGNEYLSRHPEFLTLVGPEPYDGRPPASMQGTGYPPQGQQGNWNQQQPPQQNQWNQQQAPPQNQQPPQNGGGWNQPDPWSAGAQTQPPAAPQGNGWQADAAPQGGSFLAQATQDNHWGQPPEEEPPF